MTSWPPSRRSRCSSVLSSGFPTVASPNRCQSREQSLQPRWQSKQWLLTFWPVCREGPPTESWKRAPRIAAVESVASSCFLMSWHPPPEPVDKIKRKSHCNKNAIKSKTETSIRVQDNQKPDQGQMSSSRSMSFNALFNSSSPLGSMSWSPSLYPEKGWFITVIIQNHKASVMLENARNDDDLVPECLGQKILFGEFIGDGFVENLFVGRNFLVC